MICIFCFEFVRHLLLVELIFLCIDAQERLVTNSGWKDYSRANLNYAYENFETEENGVNSRRMGGTTSMTRSSSSSHPNGRNNGNHHPRGNGGSPMRETREPYHPGVDGGMAYSSGSGGGGYRNGGPTNASQQHHYSSQPSGLSIGDTRSLQRPRPSGGSRNGGDKTWSSSGAMSDPRATYSLPRGSHGMQAGYDRSPVVEDTPDFYYLPSQRKYTGEVIRVFVKHNQQK